jgi:hypothetical protein
VLEIWWAEWLVKARYVMFCSAEALEDGVAATGGGDAVRKGKKVSDIQRHCVRTIPTRAFGDLRRRTEVL